MPVDGGHTPINEKNKHGFEALSVVVFLVVVCSVAVYQFGAHLAERQTALGDYPQLFARSATADELATIKYYSLNAIRKQVGIEGTGESALADGAANG